MVAGEIKLVNLSRGIDKVSYLSIIPRDAEFLNSEKNIDVLFVGGSNTAFSISAKYVSEKLKLEAYNLGRHASLDLRTYLRFVMRELSERGKEPIIIVSPELYMYDQKSKLDPINCWLSPYLRLYDILTYACIVEHNKFALKLLLRGKVQKNIDFYSANYFDEYGDYSYPKDFPVIPIQEDVPGNLGNIQRYKDSDLLKDLRKMYDQIYFFPVVIPQYHCDSSAFKAKDYLEFLSAFNPNNASIEHVTVCGPNSQFLDTSYHTSKELRAIRSIEVAKFLKSLMKID